MGVVAAIIFLALAPWWFANSQRKPITWAWMIVVFIGVTSWAVITSFHPYMLLAIAQTLIVYAVMLVGVAIVGVGNYLAKSSEAAKETPACQLLHRMQQIHPVEVEKNTSGRIDDGLLRLGTLIAQRVDFPANTEKFEPVINLTIHEFALCVIPQQAEIEPVTVCGRIQNDRHSCVDMGYMIDGWRCDDHAAGVIELVVVSPEIAERKASAFRKLQQAWVFLAIRLADCPFEITISRDETALAFERLSKRP